MVSESGVAAMVVVKLVLKLYDECGEGCSEVVYSSWGMMVVVMVVVLELVAGW